MSLKKIRQNFIEKTQVFFKYLINDYGYTFLGIEQSDWSDKLTYENAAIDRKVVFSNSYHPADYGFEIQWYRPSVSTNHSDREFQIYVLKENQDDDQEYLAKSAEQLRNQYFGIIKGENWIGI